MSNGEWMMLLNERKKYIPSFDGKNVNHRLIIITQPSLGPRRSQALPDSCELYVAKWLRAMGILALFALIKKHVFAEFCLSTDPRLK